MNMEDIMKFNDFALTEYATHVATCVNVGSICNDHLKSFSGSINVDNRLRNKCAIVCVGKNYPLSWEREQAFE